MNKPAAPKFNAVKNIKLTIMLPILLAIMGLMASFLLATYKITMFNIEKRGESYSLISRQFMYEGIEHQTLLLMDECREIKFNPLFAERWQSQNIDNIKKELASRFEHFHKYHNIDYINLRDTFGKSRAILPEASINDTYFNPEVFDKIKRNKKGYNGFCLTPEGKYYLKIIDPWYIDNQLIGFIELGMPFENIINNIPNSLDYKYLVAIDNKYLGNDTLADKFTIIQSSLPLTSDIEKTVRALYSPNNSLSGIYLTVNDTQYYLTDTTLASGGNPAVGKLIMLFDVSDQIAATNSFLLLVGIICFAVILLMALILYYFLNRFEQTLLKTQKELITENQKKEDNHHSYIKKLKDHVSQLEFAREKALESMHQAHRAKEIAERSQKEIHEKQICLREAQKLAKVATWELDIETQEITWSDEMYELMEENPDTYTPTFPDMIRLIHPEDRDSSKKEIDRSLKEKTDLYLQMKVSLRNNKERYFQTYCKFIKNDNEEKVKKVIIITQDITEFKNTELAYKYERDHARQYFNTVQTALFILDTEGTIKKVNEKTCQVTGYSEKELLGKNWFEDIIAGHELHHNKDYYDRLINKSLDIPEYYDNLIKTSADDNRYLTVKTTLLYDEYGNVSGSLNSAEDITEKYFAEIALKESEERFRIMADSAPVLIWMTDKNRKATYFNKTWLDFTGRTLEQELGDGWKNNVFENETMTDEEQIIRFKNHLPITQEYRLRNADGEYHWVIDHGIPIFLEDGTFNGYIGTVIDINERKEAEATLKKLAAFPYHNPNLVMTLDTSAKIRYYNPATTGIMEKYDLTEEDIYKLLPDNITKLVNNILQTDSSYKNIEVTFRENCWTWTFQPIKDQNIIHCYGTDISDRLFHEQELKKLSAAVTQSANMVCITDLNGTIEYINPQFSRVTGFSIVEAVGKTNKILNANKQDTAFYHNLWETINSGKTWAGILQNKRKNGETYWERKTIAPVLDKDNNISNYISIGEDITAEITTQQKLVESDKLSAIGTLAAGVAHEFKNYLGGIIGNASFALEELEHDGGVQLARDTLTKIIDMGDRANEVAMSLLSYSKAKPEDVKKENPRKIIEKTIKILEKELKNQSIEIITHFENTPDIVISASKLQQILLNLFINAKHAIGSDGIITVTLVYNNNYIEIKITDTGSGIKEEHLGKIFDPFFSTKGVWGEDDVVGSGMGLSICRNICREYEGNLTVESIWGIGSTFTVMLPAVDTGSYQDNYSADETGFKILVFTLNNSIIEKFTRSAVHSNTKVMKSDDILKLPENLNTLTDLVVCDCNFSGKIELFNVAQKCLQNSIPYVMVNCGAMDYQLSDIYESSLKNYKDVPELELIISFIKNKLRKEKTT